MYKGSTVQATYSNFEVKGEEFRIFVFGYSGNAGDPLRWLDQPSKTIFFSILFLGLIMEWHFPPKIWIKIDGQEVAQKPEETVVGGSMGAV